MSFSQTVGWAGSSKNGSQDWFRKEWIALTQTKLTMNSNSETIGPTRTNQVRGSNKVLANSSLVANGVLDN